MDRAVFFRLAVYLFFLFLPLFAMITIRIITARMMASQMKMQSPRGRGQKWQMEHLSFACSEALSGFALAFAPLALPVEISVVLKLIISE